MLELRTLGEVAFVEDGLPVRVETRKQVALLVYLAYHQGRALRRTDLVALLWAASAPERGRHSLSHALYRLRKRFPRLAIELSVDEVRLPVGAITLDAAAFLDAVERERFEDAVALYRGGFLDGFWLTRAPAYEEWREGERSRLERAAGFAMRQLLEGVEAAGDWPRAERLAERLLELNAFDERVHAARIGAIAASGDSSRARLEARNVERLFQEELGRDPEGELLELIQSIVAPDAVTIGANRFTDEEIPSTGFTGRASEFQALREEWNLARSGSARCVVITGEAGIGKTRICEHFLRLAVIQGARLLQGRCQPTETQIPFSGMADALVDGVRSEDIAELPQRWAHLIGSVFPSVCEPPKDPLTVSAWDADLLRRRTFDAVSRLVRAIAGSGPVVLFLDDVHWADDSTAALVHHLVRNLKDLPVIVLLALRPEEVSPDSALDRLLHDTPASDDTRRITLGELDQESVERLIDSFEERTGRTVPTSLREEVVRQAGGRPFYVIEILEAFRSGTLDLDRVSADGPPHIPGTALLTGTIEEFLRARLRGLGEEAMQVAATLAVLGRSASTEELRDVGVADERAVVLGLEELMSKGFVRDEGTRVAFAHDLTREATYRAISDLRRRHLHARAAAMLARHPESSPATLAVHYHRAGERHLARSHALRAVESSTRMHARRETEFFLELALENATTEDERLESHRRLADFYYHCSRHVDADRLFSLLEDPYCATGDQVGLLAVEVNRVAMSVQQGSTATAIAIDRYMALAARAEEINALECLADILRRLVATAHNFSSGPMLHGIVDTLVHAAERLGETGNSNRLLASVSNILSMYHSAREGLLFAERSVVMAERLDDSYMMAISLRARGMCRFHLGDIDGARGDLENACIFAERSVIGNPWDCYMILGAICLDSGDYQSAAERLEAAMQVPEQVTDPYSVIAVQNNRMLLHYERGDFDAARVDAAELLDRIRVSGHWWGQITAWGILGLCALERGRLREAEQCRAEVLRLFEGRDYWVPDISYPEMLLARLAAVEGQHAAALERLDRAIAAYAERDIFCRSRLRLERVRLLSRLDPEAAAAEAEELRELGESIGARPLVRRAEALLERLPRALR